MTTQQDINYGLDDTGVALIRWAYRFSKSLGLDGDEIVTEMTSGNIDHLVSTFNNYFGDIALLIIED